MKLSAIREKFLKFFIENHHKHVHSSPLVLEHDPTLMFTNAGMVQFKNIFTGLQKTPMTRAVSSQKCLRVGGKHNDLETVGHTGRHHTFFEMLGNFSFGDYFKETAIELAWKFITEELSIDKNRLFITVYHTDTEAYNIWRRISGFADNKIIKISTEDNFWSMGNTGPCGPCSEIFYSHDLNNTNLNDEDRAVEIWNLVFMEFNRDEKGNLCKLPKKCIDTGMGLERITAVMQNVYDNYDTDFFSALMNRSREYCSGIENRVAHKIVVDHVRASAFLIAEGVLPGNEGKNYVLRRLIRRATRYIHQLGCNDSLLHRIFPVLIDSTSLAYMGDIYPELVIAKTLIETTLKLEEENFKDTLMKGINLLDKFTMDLKAGDTLPGELAFKLHDTHGFPLDITLDILNEKQIYFDQKGFDSAMQEQRARSKWTISNTNNIDSIWLELSDKFNRTEFIGYEYNSIDGARVLAIISSENRMINSAKKGEGITIILDRTPFYGESGGQLGDMGNLVLSDGSIVTVENTNKIDGLYLHRCVVVSGLIDNSSIVTAEIDQKRRQNLRRNHSATHLLHFALRKILGDHVVQKGSLVAPDRLRFDFCHNAQVTDDLLYSVENMVNALIRQNDYVVTAIQDTKQAMAEGAMALFGEKYNDQVRVVNIGSSKELCGGTHVQRTGEIGLFKIVSESSVAFGVRRIEALTGQEAINYIRNNEINLKKIAEFVKAPTYEVINRLNIFKQEQKEYKNKLRAVHERLVGMENIRINLINGITFLSHAFIDIPVSILREHVLQQNRVKSIIAYTTTEDNKNILIVKVSKDLTNIINAKELVSMVVHKSCNGSAELVQVGYNSIENIIEALSTKIDAFKV